MFSPSVYFLVFILAERFTSLAHKDLSLLEYAVEFSQLAVLNGVRRRCAELTVLDQGKRLPAPSTSQTPPDRAGGNLSYGVWRAFISNPEHSQTQCPAHHLLTVRSTSPPPRIATELRIATEPEPLRSLKTRCEFRLQHLP